MKDEVLDRLRRENPVTETTRVPELPIEALLERLDVSDASRQVRTRRRPRNSSQRQLARRVWRRNGWAVPATGALGTGGAIALVVIAVGAVSNSPVSAAAAELRKLATIAEAQSPVTPPADGRYLYVRSIQAGQAVQGSCAVLVRQRRQIWINAVGAGRVLESPVGRSFLSAGDRLNCEQPSHQQLLHDIAARTDTWYAPGCYSLGDAGRLRGSFDDSQALLNEMHAINGGPSGPSADFSTVGTFLRESDASPALRAAIYHAAATIPGVRLIGSVTDRFGRHGIGMTLVSHDWANPNTTLELIFDPHNSALLADQVAVTDTGHQVGWDVYGKTQVVSRVPSTAPPGVTPACRAGLSYGHPGAGGVTLMTGAS